MSLNSRLNELSRAIAADIGDMERRALAAAERATTIATMALVVAFAAAALAVAALLRV